VTNGVEPQTDLDIRYGEPDATATYWVAARRELAAAELYWISTVRPGGQPHVTPLIAIWHDDSIVFTTGPDERKARNLAENPHCTFTTGRNDLHSGLDLVVEGVARRVTNASALQGIADVYVEKYGETWRFEVVDAGFDHQGGRALVFAVTPTVAFGFGKGGYSQTRWTFPSTT
jgi:hypothetical protein